jgi:hypothetical protein
MYATNVMYATCNYISSCQTNRGLVDMYATDPRPHKPIYAHYFFLNLVCFHHQLALW